MKYKILKDEFIDRAFPNAKVYVEVSGDAKIEKTTDYIIFGPIGSRESFITICKEQNLVVTGCFCGTKEEFLEAVIKKHGDNEHGVNYRRFIDFVFNGETLLKKHSKL